MFFFASDLDLGTLEGTRMLKQRIDSAAKQRMRACGLYGPCCGRDDRRLSAVAEGLGLRIRARLVR